MKSIKEKAEEYAKTKHTNKNLIEIVSWDFEAGANYVLEAIGIILNYPMIDYLVLDELLDKIKELKGEQ